MRADHRLAVLAATTAAGLLAMTGAAPATAATDEPEPLLNAADIPVLGTFSFTEFGLGDNPVVRGAVHGVQRIEGGTAIYYSVGNAEHGVDDFSVVRRDQWDLGLYDTGDVSDLSIVVADHLVALKPLSVDNHGLVSPRLELEAEPGELVVGWAVLPELPAGVDTVDVRMMRGAYVANVPVGEGALEPTVANPTPLLGEGWPELPDPAAMAQADPHVSTVALQQRSRSADDSVGVAESSEDVTVTLDANVVFAKNSADLSDAAEVELERVAADIAERGVGEVVITGHTDSDGPTDENQELSERRAESVREVVEPAAGDDVTFASEGRGETEPIEPNSTDEGKQANRRVTIEYTVAGGA